MFVGRIPFAWLGYAYYKQKDFEKAVSEFNKIVGGKDATAQNAYYHLGESYINLNKKQEALNAFRNASQMSFDLKIQEDAWLNYAKISYEIGNPYQSASQVLSDYVTKYPNSTHKEELETLLIDSYITSKNYVEALKLLEGKRSFENKVAYQKVAFYRGIEIYNEGKYLDARTLFNQSLKEPRDDKYTSRATFWKAEAEYNLTNYEEALIGFKQFEQQAVSKSTSEFKNLDYNLGYTYFKLKNYEPAIRYFNQFIAGKKDDKVRLNDAYLRLGDAYFVSSDYNKAISAYNNANKLNEIDSDYAFFQKVISAGYLGQDAKKISELEDKYPSKKILTIVNKVDLLTDNQILTLKNKFENLIVLSAKHKTGIHKLTETLTHLVNKGALSNNETIVSNSRHFEALNNALNAINSVQEGIDLEISTDLFSIDIRECLRHLGNITGEYDVDKDILGHIFSNFCIGK